MTHEEAKEIVKRIKDYMDSGECWSESEFMAMDMAIKSLEQNESAEEWYKLFVEKLNEQEPCDDAVSRQAVLKQIFYSTDNDGDVVLGSTLRRRIENLPSVTPKSETVTEFADRCRECGAKYGKLLEQKTGKWIDDAKTYYEELNKRGLGVDEYTPYFTDDIACSECLAKYNILDNETQFFKHCPNCGACMREGRTLDEFIEDSKESEE